ncbi:hypothetical protein PGT21_003793 [Puccinia graminis f. sp. tritici]|uniref:Uncharacterized protein n=1 Tax=Puccinia graminis f. sp. tritici TaxID=56615 RepID=A0A5B0QVZ4_PUCGR|nr:hypothetical protein PGTUg99_002511 [Puccinia graminis f. sp. tritici]KAA1117330.1 hypothetical protein PGT21_003793 [Puccinia graminis f. sp. tritici]
MTQPSVPSLTPAQTSPYIGGVSRPRQAILRRSRRSGLGAKVARQRVGELEGTAYHAQGLDMLKDQRKSLEKGRSIKHLWAQNKCRIVFREGSD